MSPASKPALYEDDTQAWGLIEGDALAVMAELPENSVDAICSDPPYGISFHDEAWDGANIYHAVCRAGEPLSTGEAYERWTNQWAAQCRRVLKPGLCVERKDRI
jgi:DNA modification methylase